MVDFNFRFCTESTPESLQSRLEAVLKKHGVDYDLAWTLGGLPFLTEPGDLVTAVQSAIRAETGLETELSTTGGTSDARFIRALCPVVELGLVGKTMHAVDERAPVAEIRDLQKVYERLIARYFARFGG